MRICEFELGLLFNGTDTVVDFDLSLAYEVHSDEHVAGYASMPDIETA